MKLYIMRHGTTCWNEKGIIQGVSSNRLSRTGVELVENRNKEYENVQIGLIFTSPIFRTVQTANIMNKSHNVKIIRDERLREIGQGVFTKRKKSSLTEEERYHKKMRDPLYGMESRESMYERVKSFVDDIKVRYADKSILVISHNIVTSTIEQYIKYGNLPVEELGSLDLYSNAEVRIFEL